MTEHVVFEGKVITVATKPVGGIPAFEVVHHPGAVAILPYDDEFIYLTTQYRPAVDQQVLELAAGTREPNEEPLETAKRELAEELGFSATDWEQTAEFFSSPGYTDELNYLWLATGLTEVERPQADDSEKVISVACPLSKINYLIKTAKSAKLLIGLLLLKDRGI